MDSIWKTFKFYLLDLASGNVNISTWISPFDLMHYITLPYKSCLVRIICDSITFGMFIVAWKPPTQFAWLCSDVNIYCHCHRSRKITQTWPGCVRSYRVTYSTLPSLLNLLDTASVPVPMRWVFQSFQTLLGKEGNKMYLDSCFLLHRPFLGLKPRAAMLTLQSHNSLKST